MKYKYYFAIACPFCYLGNPRIFAMEKEFGIKWELKPYSLEGSGGPSSFEPNYEKYIRLDLQRLADYYKLPIEFDNRDRNIDTTPSLEFFFIANELGKGKKYLLKTAHAYWALNKDISKPEVLTEIATSIGLERKDFEHKFGDSGLKELLKRSTEEGDSEGVFGVPSLFIGDELFWGQDRLELVRFKLQQTMRESGLGISTGVH